MSSATALPSPSPTRIVSSQMERGLTPTAISPTLRIAFSDPADATSQDDTDPNRLSYSTPPPIPLYRPLKRLLEFTELPFMILWVYSAYWVTIMSMSAPGVPNTVWYAAIVAGFLVGVALNANAYKYIVKPRSRSRTKVLKSMEETQEASSETEPTAGTVNVVEQTPNGTESRYRSTSEEDKKTLYEQLAKLVLRFPRFFKSKMHPDGRKSKAGGILSSMSSGLSSMNSFFPDGIQWSLDYGTMIRFFVIPFGVSSLAGVSSYRREEYYLVFPTDERKLVISVTVPTIVVIFLFILRIFALWRLKVKRRWKIVFFNGCLVH